MTLSSNISRRKRGLECAGKVKKMIKEWGGLSMEKPKKPNGRAGKRLQYKKKLNGEKKDNNNGYSFKLIGPNKYKCYSNITAEYRIHRKQRNTL